MFNSESNESTREIKSVIENYFEGYLKAQPEILLQAFCTDTRLITTAHDRLERTEMSEWLQNVEERHKNGDIRKAAVSIEGVDVSGHAAIAKASLVFKTFRFTDYLSLLYYGGRWKIVNKIYSTNELPENP